MAQGEPSGTDEVARVAAKELRHDVRAALYTSGHLLRTLHDDPGLEPSSRQRLDIVLDALARASARVDLAAAVLDPPAAAPLRATTWSGLLRAAADGLEPTPVLDLGDLSDDVVADVDRVTTLLGELLRFAAFDGSGRPEHVVVAVACGAEGFRLSVTDDGPTSVADRRHGLGSLNLALVARIVGRQVTVDDDVRGRVCTTVLLPPSLAGTDISEDST